MVVSCAIIFYLFGVTVEVESQGAECPVVSVEQVDDGIVVEVDRPATIRAYNPPDPAPGNIG